MRTLSIWLLLVAPALAQFAAPLDEAQTYFQARDYGQTAEIPNDGTLLDTPLILGVSGGGATTKPAFTEDATIGNYLKFVATDNDHAHAPVPVQFLNGSVTFAMRHRPENAWTIRFLGGVVDENPEVKHFMLHIGSDNKYMARFWGNGAAHPQIVAQGTVSTSTSRTDTVVVTWDADARQIKLYVNGTLEGSATHTTPRSDATQPKFQIPNTSVSLNAKLFKVATWNYALTAGQVADLTDNLDWLANAGPPGPPPPPPPEPAGKFRLRLNGVETVYERSTTVKINQVVLPPPTDDNDAVIEITEIAN